MESGNKDEELSDLSEDALYDEKIDDEDEAHINTNYSILTSSTRKLITDATLSCPFCFSVSIWVFKS